MRSLKGLHYPLPVSNVFCNGGGKRGSLAANIWGPWHRNIVFYFYVYFIIFIILSPTVPIVTRKEGKKKGMSNMKNILKTTFLDIS